MNRVIGADLSDNNVLRDRQAAEREIPRGFVVALSKNDPTGKIGFVRT